MCESQCPECALIERKRRQAEREAYEKAKKAAEARDRIEEALRRSCIPAEYRTKTFSNFLAETKNQQGALDLACRFVRGWERRKRPATDSFSSVTRGPAKVIWRAPFFMPFCRSQKASIRALQTSSNMSVAPGAEKATEQVLTQFGFSRRSPCL